MRFMLAALAFATSAPGLAQPAAAPAAPAAAAAVDPARKAAAQRVIELVWPLGSLKRVMEGSMAMFRDQGMKAAMGLPAGAVLGDQAESGQGNATLGDMIEAADPHFEERMRITNEVMMRETAMVMGREEPAIRDSMTLVYARRFTAAELGDMARFFETPTGRKYAAEALTMMQDPELIRTMQSLTPRLVGALPDIIRKVKDATAHLPPPPARESEDEAEQEVIG